MKKKKPNNFHHNYIDYTRSWMCVIFWISSWREPSAARWRSAGRPPVASGTSLSSTTLTRPAMPHAWAHTRRRRGLVRHSSLSFIIPLPVCSAVFADHSRRRSTRKAASGRSVNDGTSASPLLRMFSDPLWAEPRRRTCGRTNDRSQLLVQTESTQQTVVY